MEQHLLTDTSATDDDLRLLAQKQANNVMALFMKKGPVEAARLCIIEPTLPSKSEDAAVQVGKVMKSLTVQKSRRKYAGHSGFICHLLPCRTGKKTYIFSLFPINMVQKTFDFAAPKIRHYKYWKSKTTI